MDLQARQKNGATTFVPMTITTLPTPTRFVRDRLTWMMYTMFGCFAYFVIAMGPIQPFLRSELQLTYAVGGLHLSMLAFGNVLVGTYGQHVIRRFGRSMSFWCGGAGMTLSALCLVFGNHVVFTLTGAFLIGLLGTFVPILAQSVLADHHGERRAVAITEVNVVVMVFGGMTPLLVGLAEHTGIGWRSTLFLGVVLWVLLTFLFRQEGVPEHVHMSKDGMPMLHTNNKLPLLFWGYWSILFLSVAIEWCISLWGSTFFTTVVGLTPSLASAIMSIFFFAMIIGRVASSFAVRTLPLMPLLLLAESTALVGFLLLWLSPVAALNIAGLGIAGIGIAGLFPLAVAAGFALVPEQSILASARSSQAAGLAMLTVPVVLGWVADQVSLYYAFSLVIVLLIVIGGITLRMKE